MSSHLNLLTRNVAFFGGIAVIGRILNFIGLPLLAWFIADPSVLGRFDLLITIGSLGAAIANLGVNEAAHKVYFESSDSKHREDILTAFVTVGILVTLISVILSILGAWLASDFINVGTSNVEFSFMVAMFIIAFRLRFLFEVPLMLENKKRIVGAVGLLEIAAFYISAIIIFKLFSNDYIALAVSRLLSIILSAILLYYYSLFPWFRWYFHKETIKRLLLLGLPLTFSSLFYWGLSLSDRVIIGTYLGAGSLGTYAVCAKFAAISELIRTGISQGMTFFIFSTSKDEGHDERMYLVTSFFLVISTFLFGMGYLFSPLIVNLFLPFKYIEAAVIIPYLFVGPLLLAAFQIIGSDLILVEKLCMITLAQVIGVAMTLAVSLFLVRPYGLIGPAIGTLSGYITMFIVALFASRRCGRQAFCWQLIYWLIPLILIVLLSLIKYWVNAYLITLITIASTLYWTIINRKLTISAFKAVYLLLRRQ